MLPAFIHGHSLTLALYQVYNHLHTHKKKGSSTHWVDTSDQFLEENVHTMEIEGVIS